MMERLNNIAIIFPAHNEDLTIVQTLTEFHAAISSAQLWVIDNASTDSTNLLAKQFFLNNRVRGASSVSRALGREMQYVKDFAI